LGGVCFNKEGQRFIREDTWYGYLGDAGARQTEGIYYIIYDDNMRAHAKKDHPTWLRHKEFKGDTIEAAAKEVKIDPAALKATIEKYNKNIAKGTDPDFGRSTLDGTIGKPFPMSDKGPYYIMECKPSTTSFKGGIRIDTEQRVLDWDGYVIPRLYAAGECTGGYFGKGGYIWGTMTVMSLTCGMIAAWQVNRNKPV
jgi:fumarate reductase flavoprotein subunit